MSRVLSNYTAGEQSKYDSEGVESETERRGKEGGDPGGGRAAQTHGGERKRLVRRGREVAREEGKVEKGWKEGGESGVEEVVSCERFL